MKTVMLIMASFLIAISAAAENCPQITMTLIDAETRTLDHSQKLKVKILEMESAKARADSQFSLFWPQIAVEGQLNFASEIPSLEINLPYGRSITMQVGDRISYSLGAVAAWNLWDSGRVYYNWKALEHAVQSKKMEVELTRQEMVMKARSIYFKTQMSREQVRLLDKALETARIQHKDIVSKAAAGAVSRADMISSRVEVIARESALKRAFADLSDNIRELFNLTGMVNEYDLTHPVIVDRGEKKIPATVEIKLDELEQSLKALMPAAEQKLSGDHPRGALFSELAKMARRFSVSIESNHWPTIQATAKSGLEYHNGMVSENVYQNRAGLKANWPVFQGFYVKNLEREQAVMSQTYEHQLGQSVIDLNLEWMNAKERFAMLLEEKVLVSELIQENRTLATMMYQAYLAGRADYTKVENANLRVLESEVKKIRNQVEQLMVLAIMDGLAEKKVRDK